MARSEQEVLRLFDEHHPALYRFAWRLTGSAADAEDAVQEAFLGLLRPGCGFDPERSGIRTYLFGAVRNQCLKRLRQGRPLPDGRGFVSGVDQTQNRERERADGLELPEVRTPESELLRGELADAVAAAIAALPETQREVLILAHYEQLSLAEIAGITELEIGAVKSRLQRARAALRETLAAYAPLEKKA
jgi:RNA polymerase sigma-70 factor (ECF subfamily)